ncbi:MAG: glycosyltransferase family 2 protein [Spirochaetae bacterium HGW-Spirochaetae-2]|jgi:glycosyltransferase involved in cell wall biosynthesis|nr:MAG: glycosyltransferase family 2 protein [Spirochaetae bacterium HGW-Spirochaetae-2]
MRHEMQSNKILTIFTPTYNRAYILPKLYESLVSQTSKNFKWLLVDDGSTDSTEELIATWISDALIDIKYVKQENGGKQRAHNRAVSICDTELFLCVDSDDFLIETAVNSFIEAWNPIREDNTVSGIIALKGYDLVTPIGTGFPKGVSFSPLSQLYQKYGYKGETALMFRSSILKDYFYDVADGEKFITESYIYMQIDQKYTMLILNKILNICGYQEDGYTKNIYKVIYNNPVSYMRLKKLSMELSPSLKFKYLNAINLISAFFIVGKKERNFRWNLYTLPALLPGYIVYCLRFKKFAKTDSSL